MSLDEAKCIAVKGERAEIGEVAQALDVLFQRVTELEHEKTKRDIKDFEASNANKSV